MNESNRPGNGPCIGRGLGRTRRFLFVWLIAAIGSGQALAADLTGTLIGSDGSPAGGAEVLLYDYHLGDTVSVEVTGETGDQPFFRQDYFMDTAVSAQLTDEDGTFEFSAPEGLYILIVSPRESPDNAHFIEDVEPMPISLAGPLAGGLDLGEVRLRPRGAYVTGTVSLDGAPAQGALVTRWAESMGSSSAPCLTDANGQYRHFIYDVPDEGTEITFCATQIGEASAIQQLEAPAPWSSRTADIALTFRSSKTRVTGS